MRFYIKVNLKLHYLLMVKSVEKKKKLNYIFLFAQEQGVVKYDKRKQSNSIRTCITSVIYLFFCYICFP